MDLSIVTTLYRSAPYLEEFCARVGATAAGITADYEIILVNDGSPDNALEVALALHAQDAHIKIIDLSRNFGHHKAMMTGFAHARGERVFQIDCDLEEAPELLAQFHAVMKASSADVVYGVRSKREGGLVERVGNALFWRAFNLLSDYPVPANMLSACLMSRRYVEGLVAQGDREIFLPGLQAITGFRQVAVTAEKKWKGRSTYNLGRKIALCVNAITSFSSKPLIWIFCLGCAISLAALVAAGYLIVNKLFFGGYLAGWPSVIVSIWLLGGIIIFCLGVIGIYLSKIFMETKRRPLTVLRQIYDRDPIPSDGQPSASRRLRLCVDALLRGGSNDAS